MLCKNCMVVIRQLTKIAGDAIVQQVGRGLWLHQIDCQMEP